MIITFSRAVANLNPDDPATRAIIAGVEQRILTHGRACFCHVVISTAPAADGTHDMALVIGWPSAAELEAYGPTAWHAEDRRLLGDLRREPVERHYYRTILDK